MASLLVQVDNLPVSETAESIRRLFKKYDDKLKVKLHRDLMSGKFTGQALVTFSKEEHAMAAIHELNGYLYHDKVLAVEMASPAETALKGSPYRKGPVPGKKE